MTHNKGFTLVEIVVGLVVLAIALVGISSTLFQQSRNSVDPVYQVRATELGQSLLTEILALDFDQANSQGSSAGSCNPVPPRQCSTTLGAEEPSREDWNDVDDFDGYTTAGELLSGATISDLYRNFEVSVTVCYAATSTGSCGPDATIEDYKRIQVDVTTPNGQVITFAAYRGNL